MRTSLHEHQQTGEAHPQALPATCDAVEALLRLEFLAHLPEWLSP